MNGEEIVLVKNKKRPFTVTCPALFICTLYYDEYSRKITLHVKERIIGLSRAKVKEIEKQEEVEEVEEEVEEEKEEQVYVSESHKKTYITLSQVVKSVEAAKEFCEENDINPDEVIIVWRAEVKI